MLNRIILYSYNAINLEDILGEVQGQFKVIVAEEVYSKIRESKDFDDIFTKYKYIDMSLLMLGDNERVDAWLQPVILLVQQYLSNYLKYGVKFVIDKRYARNVVLNLPYFFSECESLEKELGLDQRNITNIVDIDMLQLEALFTYITENLYGNGKFKRRLFEEIKKFRNFNRIGERKIFSVFLCGPSGIGKTETAWLLHNKLAPEERFIKINLGNYSEHNALSSLIGSPRGFIGSSKGELTDKIETSKSKIILIDEFEKASTEIHNFFLELLSDGRFTDSLGREYDLDKYVIVFTSNVGGDEFAKKVSPELRSRFDLKYQMVPLTDIEKQQYLSYKTEYYLEKVESVFHICPDKEQMEKIMAVPVSKYSNLRDINRILENHISTFIDESVHN